MDVSENASLGVSRAKAAVGGVAVVVAAAMPLLSPWDLFDEEEGNSAWRPRLASFRRWLADYTPPPPPPVSRRPDVYFERRSALLVRLGLNPDDDDSWAIPDHDLVRIARGRLVYETPWCRSDYGDGDRYCVRCFDDLATDGSLCAMCRHEQQLQQRRAS